MSLHFLFAIVNIKNGPVGLNGSLDPALSLIEGAENLVRTCSVLSPLTLKLDTGLANLVNLW